VRRGALTVALAGLLGAAAPAGARRSPTAVAILGIDGPADLCSRLGIRLPRNRRLSGGGWLVIGPAELVARLRRQPEVSSAVARAEAAVRQAEQALAQMERSAALAAGERALSRLRGVAGRFHSGPLMARAQLALAQAWLLHPERRDRSLAAARAAVRLDPELRPDPQQLSPKVTGLLDQARAGLAPPPPPTREELTRLAALAGTVDHLVWLRIRPGGATTTVSLLAFGDRAGVIHHETHTLTAEKVEDRLARLVSEAVKRTGALRERQEPPPPPPTVRPWYRRWWVWAGVGVVLVGAGVTAGVLLGQGADEGYDLTVRFR
jgi:hypothetical protein